MATPITAVPAADTNSALAYFGSKLRFETDCRDVNESLQQADMDFVLLDVRSPAAYARGHIAGAVNLPHAQISSETLAGYPAETVFVVYCAGPHCNGADRAAVAIAQCRRPVKLMLGGIAGWLDEGFALVNEAV